MDGPRGYYRVLPGILRQRKLNTAWFHLYAKSKKQNKENRKIHRYWEHTGGCYRGRCEGGNGWNRLRGTNFQP